MSHLSLEDLLRVRDDEGTATAARHLEECADCRRELEALYQVRARLRALPARCPPRDRWPQVRDAALGEWRRVRLRRGAVVTAVLAATVVLALGVRLTAERWQARRQEQLHARTVAAHVIDLRERSQLLDAELRRLAVRPRVVDAWRAETIIGLEDRIAQLDGELALAAPGTASTEAVALWRERVELQGALLNVHLAPVSHHGL